MTKRMPSWQIISKVEPEVVMSAKLVAGPQGHESSGYAGGWGGSGWGLGGGSEVVAWEAGGGGGEGGGEGGGGNGGGGGGGEGGGRRRWAWRRRTGRLMLGVQNDVRIVRKLVCRGNLPADKGALLGQAQDKATRWLKARPWVHIVVVNVAVQQDVLHQISIGIRGHLATVLWVRQA